MSKTQTGHIETMPTSVLLLLAQREDEIALVARAELAKRMVAAN